MPLLNIRNLHIHLRTFEGELKVLNGVDLEIEPGERVGLVGETGCGKTLLTKVILGILPANARIVKGEILFCGKDLLRMTPRERRWAQRQISCIFQDPLEALNPVFTIEDQFFAVLRAAARRRGLSTPSKTQIQRKAQAVHILKETGMPDPERVLKCYPIQLSGGMRQRVCIAMALATGAQLILADEPTTNLDVTTQFQILEVLNSLVTKNNVSVLLISHSLGIVKYFTTRTYIMYAGNIVEGAETPALFNRPLHPYTQGLLESVPKLTGETLSEGIEGTIPDYLNPPSGCRFNLRCRYAMPICSTQPPPCAIGDKHFVACWLHRDKEGRP